MRTFSAEELNEILENHKSWLKPGGKSSGRAVLIGAKLSKANLREANLREANLSEAYLSEAYLTGADLRGANLRGSNLIWADLTGANLREANLREANLREANLREANLRGAYLTGANLRGADLRGSYLIWADFTGADLRGADLRGADLRRSYLGKANLSEAKLDWPLVCPEKGSFIGYKKCRDNLIAELEIPEDAIRSSATSRKCRCSKAMVLNITSLDGSEVNVEYAVSGRDSGFLYKVGEVVSVDDFDTNRWNECSTGIHFFMTREEAINY